MRRAAAFVAALLFAGPALARCVAGDGAWITRACYDTPKADNLYRHDILGGTPEWSRLVVTLGPKGRAVRTGAALAFPVARHRLYEDTAPRLADLDGDGRPEIIVVEADHRRGARLLALFLDGRSSATPFIGTPRRWLAPVGVVDLDGDGRVEIAYVETPHRDKVLKIARLDANLIRVVAKVPGLTNHRIGDDFIQGGIALCDGQPTVLTANADWSRIIGTRFEGGTPVSRDLAAYAGSGSFAAVPGCR